MFLALVLAVLAHPGATALPVPPAQAPPAHVVAIPEHALTFDFAFAKEIAADKVAKDGAERVWEGTYEGSDIAFRFAVVDAKSSRLLEPEDVVESIRDSVVDTIGDKGLAFEPLRTVRASCGASPLLAITRTDVLGSGSAPVGEIWLIGNLLEKGGWYLRVDVKPALTAEARASLSKSLETCATWKGTPRDPRWTDAEAKAYFDALSPEDAKKKYQKPLRTEHFIVLSPHSSANQYAKKLEGWYAEINKVLPFDESKDRRLLPILLYRHDEEFIQFYVDVYKEKSRNDIDFESWCGGDWYATHFDNDSEYDNRMELTKLLLINRARGWGACDWFRNGLREYCATRANERGDAVRAAKRKRGTPLEKLFDDDAWGDRRRRVEKRGADEEVDYWEQSALWMEFLREGKETKAKFPTFVREMGAVADEDIARVNAVLKQVYGWETAELEKRWLEYCETRK